MPSPSPELGHRLLQAGAGAGKTTTLIKTFLDFVRDYRARKNEFPRVIITTFTRKATQEVKERLMRKALELGEDDVFKYLGQRSRVHISTIHGVLSAFLSRYGERIGLAPDFRVIAEDDLRWLGRRELRRILADPNDEALFLLEDQSFSELWLGIEEWRNTAGSEKSAKFANVDYFRRQTGILLDEFFDRTHSIVDEIRSSVETESWVKAAEMLSGLKKPKTDDEIEAFIDQLQDIDEWWNRPRKSKAIPETLHESFREFVDNFWKTLTGAKNDCYRPSFWKDHDERCRIFEALAKKYQSALDAQLLKQGLVSMSDLEHRSLEVLQADPSAGVAFSREWDYWMIDEYQDTSPLQVKLLQALVGDRPHFIVGDPQQSIYFFRGARSEVFLAKKKEFEQKAHQVERVAVNYRSRAPLLHFFNDFFKDNRAFSAMEATDAKAALAELPAADIRIVRTDENEDHCVLAVIERIQELLKSGAAAESICVVAKQNSYLRQILNEARKLNIPMQLHTAGGFSKRREVGDVANFLKFILNPSDNLNLLSILRSPWFYLPDEEILKTTLSQPVSVWVEAQKIFVEASEGHPIQRLKAWLDKSSGLGLAGVLSEFYRQEGIMDSANMADPSGRREANLWKLLIQLENAQKQAGFNGLAFTRDFESGGGSTENGNEDGDAAPAIEPKRVNLMTVHGSKGLEFDHVIVTHMHTRPAYERTEFFLYDEDNRLWTLAAKNLAGQKTGSMLAVNLIEKTNERLNEESARVLYVALTRAKQSVTLVWEDKERMSEKSWAALVPFSKEEGEHKHDNFTVRVRRNDPAPVAQKLAAVTAADLRPRWTEKFKEPRKIVSATELLEKALLAEQAKKDAEKPRPPESAARALRIAQRGTDAHRLFEALKYTSVENVRKMTKDTEIGNSLDWLLALKNPPVQQLIEAGEPEWGFAVQGKDFILQGQIDLWAELNGEIWIIDYKTGSVDYAEKAIDQMAIYAWALHRLKRLKLDQKVNLVAVYPLEKQIKGRTMTGKDLEKDWQRLLPN